ncbi:MAG TPA: hypothetical protein VM784_10650 [Actinomycetota bacterium]|nr:hypothetical protein [Actinomycetota bacterium]
MRRTFSVLLVLTFVLSSAVASGAPKYKRLGDDPSGDGPPALDVVYLEVARVGKTIDIRLGIDGMLPRAGGYPEAPGIEWVFTTGKRTFIAEAVAGTGPQGRFYLFELMKDGSLMQHQGATGTYDAADGFASVQVPLQTIGARKGTVLRGFMLDETGGDVDAHVHVGPQTHYADSFATTKKFVIP